MRVALGATAALGGALAVILVTSIPGQPLPAAAPPVEPAPARDFTAAELSRARAFSTALSPPSYVSLAVGLVVSLALGFTPLGARLVGALTRGRWWLRAGFGAFAVTLLGWLATVPFGAWSHAVLRRYGLSSQMWGAWVLDQLKSFALSAALTVAVLVVLVALIRALPRWWWAPSAVGGFALVVGLSFAYPVVVEPVFNDFRSMRRQPLRTELLTMARSDGVPVDDVLVADASRRTNALNAYVSGFGSTRRIVVYDTLLRQAPPAQVRLIVAHELGHAANRDVLYGTLLGGFGAAFGVCLLHLVLSSRWLQRRAGVAGAGDPRAVPLILAVVAVFTTLAGPAQNLVSRHIEARADAHALNLTADAATFVRMQRALAVRNLATLRPNPVEHFLFATHPSPAQRMAIARAWTRLHDRPVPPPLAPEPPEPPRP